MLEMFSNGPAGKSSYGHFSEVRDWFTMPIASLVAEKLDAARSAIDIYVEDESCEAVYLSGSLLAGLGTPYSDIDVFVITAKAGTPGEADSVVQHGNGPDRVDVEFRSEAWLDQVASLAQPYAATVDDNHALQTTDGLIDDAIRLKIGQVVKLSPRLTTTRASMTVGEANLRKLMIAHLAADLGNYWMDALGFWCIGDHESLDLMSRCILATSIDAACVTCGDLYRGEKWIWPRALRNEPLSGMLPWLRYLLLDGAGAAPRMLAAQKMLASAILREWSGVEFPALWPPEAVSGHSRRALVRSPYWMITRMADSALLTDRDLRHYSVSDLAVSCWAAADGISAAEIESWARRAFPGTSMTDIRGAISGLERIGALTTGEAWTGDLTEEISAQGMKAS